MSRLSITSRSTFFFLGRDFKNRDFSIEIYLRRDIYRDRRDKSRLSRFSRFVETFRDLSRLFEIYRDISTLSRLFEVLQDQKSWQIEKSWSRNVIKVTNSRSRLRQTVEICQKCHVSTDFSISIETFGTGRWCRDKIEISWSRSRYLNHRDQLFETVEIFSTVKTDFVLVSRLRVSIETTSRQIETPNLIKFMFLRIFNF